MPELQEAYELLEKASALIEASGAWPSLADEAAELAIAVDAAVS